MEWMETVIGFEMVFGCGIGIHLFGTWAGKQTEKPIGFWANGTPLDPKSVTDIPAYNRAFGQCFRVYAIPFLLSGILMIRFAIASLITLFIWGAFGTWWLIHRYKAIEKKYILQ